jgi:inosine-uridine nucleoside N-ribohydrolase
MRRRVHASEPNAQVAVDVDVPAFSELLLERLGSLDGSNS